MAAFAVGVWIGVAVGLPIGLAAPTVAAATARWARHRDLLLILVVGLVAGVAVGIAAGGREMATRTAVVPAGRVTMTAVATSDAISGYDFSALVTPVAVLQSDVWLEWRGPTLLASGVPGGVMVGELLLIDGTIEPRIDSFRGRWIGGLLLVRSADRVATARNPLLAVGNLMRRRVLGSLDSAAAAPAGALLTGFLIGDVSRLPTADRDALRAAGLSHFVAVSGSNVALFLAAWWLAGAPLRLGPRRRAAFGIVGITVFAIITRWEPSVVRASIMAGLVLVGRWAGRPITPWTALGGAVALSLLIAPGLAGDFGFGLSVAATAGIILGSPLWAGRHPRILWAVLGATISAQAAVAPLLLLWFCSIPLLAPITNLVAAPLVAISTAVGGIGATLQIPLLVNLGVAAASTVLAIARTAADLPQLDGLQTLALAVPMVLAVRFAPLRPALLGLFVLIVMLSISPVRPPAVATVYFLDVGQGDATLFIGPSGESILVDGGPDPGLLRAHLRKLGVRRIDVLIITDRHADHTTGILGLPGAVPVGLVWQPPPLRDASALDAFVAELETAGTQVSVPLPGESVRVGAFGVAVLGPIRTYAGSNDGSIVVEVNSNGVSVLMSADIETYAQQDLGPLRRDVLKVPHHGAATTDLEWLAASAPEVAVISVGSNDYGHPSPRVVEVLEAAGSLVLRTDRAGTIAIPFVRGLEPVTGLPSGS